MVHLLLLVEIPIVMWAARRNDTAQGNERDPNRDMRLATLTSIATQTGGLGAMGRVLGKNCTLWRAYYAPKTVIGATRT